MYEYDPSSFRGVFERDLGYLAGVARSASCFADQVALSEIRVNEYGSPVRSAIFAIP